VVIENSVRECRKRINLTQEDLGALLGVSRQTVIAIENKKYNPSLELALKMGRLFNRPVEAIFILPPSDNEAEPAGDSMPD
jgi:putative transcriptional regulator